MRMILMTGLALCGAFVLIGNAARAQTNVNCNDPKSQFEMTACANRDWQRADRELNAAYKIAMKAMRTMDSYLSGDLKGAATALRDAQRAWIPYRDKACDSYGFQARGGTMEPMLVFGCRAEITRQRTQELRDLAAGLEN